VPEFGTRVKVDYLLGMAQLGKKFALLLDVDKVLSTDELLHLNGVTSSAEEGQATEAGAPVTSEAAPLSEAGGNEGEKAE
jgi:hypothetical protein